MKEKIVPIINEFFSFASRKHFKAGLYSVLILATFLWAWTLLHDKLGSHFTQDSYAYYLLGKNLFSGLGYTTFSARDLAVEPVWPVLSKSFPPLHPILSGLVNSISDLGIRSLSLLSLIYLAATLVVILMFGNTIDKNGRLFVFFAFAALIATNSAYREELEAGRSIPGMIVFFLLTMFLFYKTISDNAPKYVYEILCGFSAAAIMLQRFDQTLFCAAFPILSLCVFRLQKLSWHQSLIKTGLITFSFGSALLPWTVRNIVQFGAPFASDNTGSVTTTFRGLQCCAVWLPGSEPPTLFTNPSMWMDQRILFLKSNFKSIMSVSHYTVFAAMLFPALIWKKLSFFKKICVSFMGIHFLTSLATVSLTPYGDARYFSLVHLNFYIILAVCVSSLLENTKLKAFSIAAKTTGILLLAFAVISSFTVKKHTDSLLNGRIIPQTTEALEAQFLKMDKIVSRHLKEDDILSLKPNAEGYAVFTGRRTVYYPSTVGSNRKILTRWMKKWNIEYLLLPKKDITKLRLQSYVLENVYGRLLVDGKAYLRE